MCELYKVNKVETSGYHPAAKGQVEKLNSKVLAALFHWLRLCQSSWDQLLAIIAFVLRTTPD